MAISANAYQNSSTNSDYTSPIVWSPESEQFIYDEMVFLQFAVNDPTHLNKPGRQGNYTLEREFSMGLLTEGVATPVSALEFDQVTITFDGYGDAKQITDEKLVQSFAYVMDGLRRGALGAMAENRDAVIVTECLTTSSTGIYPNGTNSGTITSSDTFNTDMVADLDAAMALTQARKPDAIVVHPNQKASLMKLADFIDASRFGSDRVVRTGEIGEYLGVRILRSPHITSATENSTTVYKALAFGRRPFIYAQKRNFEFSFERERLRDRAVTASWWEMFGVSILRDDSIVVMTSA